ncbi:MAG: hypothetical protein ACTSPS_05580 [Promethearchaeota archaeon]
MSIDKWLSESDPKKREKLEKVYNALPEEKVQDLKKKSIRELTKKKEKEKADDPKTIDILDDILEFKEWLNQRNYLKGDIDKIEIWINNLSKKLNREREKNIKESIKDNRGQLIQQFRKIPFNFLDEKTRIAVNKKLHGQKRTNSDNYYLRKLKAEAKEKLYEASYFEILKAIIELKYD